jgi:hypothetical protein
MVREYTVHMHLDIETMRAELYLSFNDAYIQNTCLVTIHKEQKQNSRIT